MDFFLEPFKRDIGDHSCSKNKLVVAFSITAVLGQIF